MRFPALGLVAMVLAGPVSAAGPLKPAEGDYTLPDFHFADGASLPALRLHYRTLGTPRRDSSGVVRNAVLILHGTGGDGTQFLSDHFAGVLFGPGQPLDIDRYYVILPDGIGHGRSSKPSEGLHARFPHYGYRDMVAAQHELLTRGLGVNHLRLVMGTSMGGMHTWLWGESYPEFMDALLPLASLPVQIAGRNRMMRRMVMDSIQQDPTWEHGEYQKPPRGVTSAAYTIILMSSCPRRLQHQAPTRDAADKLFDGLVARLASRDANDLLYQFAASADYDPAPALEKIRVPLVAINSADDQINPPELGLMEQAIARVERGRYVLLPITDQTVGHSTHTYPAIWKEHLAALLDQSKP